MRESQRSLRLVYAALKLVGLVVFTKRQVLQVSAPVSRSKDTNPFLLSLKQSRAMTELVMLFCIQAHPGHPRTMVNAGRLSTDTARPIPTMRSLTL